MRLWLQAPLSEPMEKRFGALFDSNASIYVLGLNRYAESVASVLPVVAFVDDYTPEVEYLGRPIVKVQQLPSDAVVVSCVVDGRPLSALSRLRSAGVTEAIDYFSVYRMGPRLFKPPPFSSENLRDILGNTPKYDWLSLQLADEESRRTLEKLTNFRLNWNLEHMAGFSVDFERQYFEPFVELGAGEVFVDGGGFDGQTSRAFARHAPGYKRIYYFEPNPEMMALSRGALADIDDVCYVSKGLFSCNGVAQFDSSAGSASGLAERGALEIPIVRLDDEVEEPVTFIKLDLEGAECEALEGAREHLRRHRPKLAVSVYHDQRDFWRVPEKVLSINETYRLYLRHYTEGPLETVMYFV